MMTDDVYWVAKCGNEWCSGPETIAIVNSEPTKICCPHCGWIAWIGNGITKRVIPKQYVGSQQVK